MSVLATFMPVTETRKEAVGTAKAVETAEAGKDGKKSKDKYQNLTQVLCIRYLINFEK